MRKKLLFFLFWGCIALTVTGCGRHGNLHEYDDFINYVNNLQFGVNGKKLSCNLEGNYEILKTKDGIGKYGEKTRTYTFKVKNTDILFDVKSFCECTNGLDSLCFDYTYKLTDILNTNTSYLDRAFKYYIEEYNKKVNFDNKLQHYSNTLSKDVIHYDRFDIITLNELTYIINYINGFLDYINDLNIKFIDDYKLFTIEFIENKYGYDDGWNYNLRIYFDIDENGKYIYEFNDEYYPNDEKLKTYIYNYMNDNGIVLK